MGVSARYDRIGTTYSDYRRPDPRVASAIADAVGGARSVVDVGTGTGSYEPDAPLVVGVDPSITMLLQRASDAAPAVLGVAEALPFADDAFDVATAILTVHHWPDHARGLREMARVSERQVVLTWDRDVVSRFWLVADYFPEVRELERDDATAGEIASVLDVVETRIVPVPWDCTDGFLGCYWRRPEWYLDPDARHAISGFARQPHEVAQRVVDALRADLEDRTWQRRYASLLELDEFDLGYRLLIAEGVA